MEKKRLKAHSKELQVKAYPKIETTNDATSLVENLRIPPRNHLKALKGEKKENGVLDELTSSGVYVFTLKTLMLTK